MLRAAEVKPLNPLTLPTQKVTLGCPVLDRLLSGGLPVACITEISGESSAGKTQLCLQLSLSTPSSSTLFIHSEFPFPLRRLLSLSSTGPTSSNPLDHILVRGVHSPSDLLSLLTHADTLLLLLSRRPPVRLIIVDSIAALFRSEFDNNLADLNRRSKLFFKIAAKLKEQAQKFNLAVVVTNQVVDLVGPEEGANSIRVGNFGELWTSGRRVLPALGLAWANCVNLRLFLSRREEIVRRVEEEIDPIGDLGIDPIGDLGRVRTRRMIQVVFAPHLPESSCEFVIVREGVFGVSL